MDRTETLAQILQMLTVAKNRVMVMALIFACQAADEGEDWESVSFEGPDEARLELKRLFDLLMPFVVGLEPEPRTELRRAAVEKLKTMRDVRWERAN